jgi:hypothetical protein
LRALMILRKPIPIDIPNWDRYDTNTQRLIAGERRPAIMEWLAMTPQ